jgi:hypothetical protein
LRCKLTQQILNNPCRLWTKVLNVPFSYLDILLFEAKIRELGIKKPELLALFRDIPHLPEKEKRAIINAYIKVKEKMGKKK